MFGILKDNSARTPAQKILELEGESNAIVGFIEETIADLQDVNERIAREKNALSEEINNLVKARDAAGMQMQRNANIAGKFNSFLND